MSKRHIVLNSAIAALIAAGVSVQSAPAMADDASTAPSTSAPAATTDAPAAATPAAKDKDSCKGHKKHKKGDKDSCKGKKKAGKDGCNGKDGCKGKTDKAADAAK